MQNLIIQIATFLNIPSIDVYFLGILLVVFGIFCVLGITKIYEILFGLVLGMAIFIVMQFLLLNANLTVPTFINPEISKFIVGSSIYLIFILSILVPLNGSLNVNEPKNTGIKILYTITVSAILTIFYTSLIFGFIEKTYIFTLDNAFQFIKKVNFWNQFTQESRLYPMILNQVPSITLFGVFFVIYRVTFNDIVNMIAKSLFEAIKKMSKGEGGKGNAGGGGNDNHHGGH